MRWIHNDEHSLVEDERGAVIIATVHFPIYGALISAAPQLLEALEAARAHIAELQALAALERRADRVPMGSTPYVLECIDLAIKEAKGREPGPDLADSDPEPDPLLGK